MSLRIASTRPHGTQVHYDLRYIGRVPGAHDLRWQLLDTNGVPATNLPPLLVEVAGGFDLQVAVVVTQHEETAFRACELDDGVHHLVEHFL